MIAIAILVLASLTGGPGECVPVGVDPATVPFVIPAGTIEGLLLCPDPNDPNDWHAPVGKFNRAGRWCDEDRDAIVVRVKSSSTPGASATLNGERWLLVGDVAPGLNVFIIEAEDVRSYGDSLISTWTVLVWGDLPPNHKPVLY